MRKYFQFNLLFYLVTIAGSFPNVTWASACQSAHSQEAATSSVLQAFTKVWGQPGIYIEHKCHSNVIRLYEALKRQNPSLRPQDFQVLYITWPEGWLKNRNRFFVPQLPRRENQHQGLRYHVALEYKGAVLDLELLNSSQIMPTEKYLQDLIRPSDRPSLVVHFIPGEDYLTWPIEYPDRKEEFHNRIFFQTPMRSLSQPTSACSRGC